MCESCLYGDGGATGGMWDGVRCDIDDRSVFWSPISPWLNVRSQWKGGTANATKSQWQPDPWERETTFFFNQILLLCPPPPPYQPPFQFLFTFLFLVMSNSSFLNLWFFCDHKQVPPTVLALVYILFFLHTHKGGSKVTTFSYAQFLNLASQTHTLITIIIIHISQNTTPHSFFPPLFHYHVK